MLCVCSRIFPRRKHLKTLCGRVVWKFPIGRRFFGRQLVMDEQDHILMKKKRLLIHATQVGWTMYCTRQGGLRHRIPSARG